MEKEQACVYRICKDERLKSSHIGALEMASMERRKKDNSNRKDKFELAQNIGGFIELVRPSSTSVKNNSLKQVLENEPLELVLSNGLRVRIPTRFDTESLKMVIETL